MAEGADLPFAIYEAGDGVKQKNATPSLNRQVWRQKY